MKVECEELGKDEMKNILFACWNAVGFFDLYIYRGQNDKNCQGVYAKINFICYIVRNEFIFFFLLCLLTFVLFL